DRRFGPKGSDWLPPLIASQDIADTPYLSSKSFIEITDNIIVEPTDDLDQKDLIGCQLGCDCVEDNRRPKSWCECSHNRCGVDYNYDTNGSLIDCLKPIHECGDNCFCGRNPLLKTRCGNRWTQRGTKCVTQLFADPLKGYSVRTVNDVKFGQFVVEYCGEVIDTFEAKKRFRLYAEDCDQHNYILVFREHFGSESTFEIIIDAKYYGNGARFVNHSCEPNLIALPVRSDSLRPRICLFAAKDIVAGTELSYNYGSSDSPLSDKICYCGSDYCRVDLNPTKRMATNAKEDVDDELLSQATSQDLNESQSSDKKKRIFSKELRCMMYGFGDDHNPYTETVDMFEDLVIQFITDIALRAMEMGRPGRVAVEDIMHLVQRDGRKFSRVKDLLTMNEELKKARKAFDEVKYVQSA
ncbi:unnamed protein product, partial [Medioppia subpectinata]